MWICSGWYSSGLMQAMLASVIVARRGRPGMVSAMLQGKIARVLDSPGAGFIV